MVERDIMEEVTTDAPLEEIEVFAMLAMLEDEYLVSESGGRVVTVFVTYRASGHDLFS
jgi:hypothetical protein